MKKNVLIIDDEIEICMLLSSIMQKYGYNTTYSHTVKGSVMALAKEQYKIVFLDLNLPDGVGFEVLPYIKKNNSEVKTVVISAYDGAVERQQARDKGAQYFIGKPFSLQNVKAVLENINTSK